MKIKLDEVKEVKLAVYNLNILTHPSREKFYAHTYDDNGKVKSRYLQHIGHRLKKIISKVSGMEQIQAHLLKVPFQFDPSKKYNCYLVIISSTCYSGEFHEFRKFGLMEGGNLVIIDPKQILGSLRQVDHKLSIDPFKIPMGIYQEYGFELSTIEHDFLIEDVFADYQYTPDQVPLKNIKDRLILGEYRSKSVSIPYPSISIAIGSAKLLSPLISHGIIITDDRRKFSYLDLDHIYTMDSYSTPIGINLIQMYVQYPGLLIELMETLETLSGNYIAKRKFLSIMDELYSNFDPEDFIGLNILDFFINDNSDVYETLSDQQAKYNLHQLFTQFLSHPFFSENKPDLLQEPGIHLMDVTQLDTTTQLTLEIVLRLMRRHGILRGQIISDIIPKYLHAKKFDKLTSVHTSTLCEDLVLVFPELNETILNYTWDLILYSQEDLTFLNTWNRSRLGIHKEQIGNIIATHRSGLVVFLDSLICRFREIKEEILVDVAAIFSRQEYKEETVAINFEDEEEDVYNYSFLSQYHIVSVLAAMSEYRCYTIDEVELSLMSMRPLEDVFDLLESRMYLTSHKEGFEVTSKGRSYVYNIRSITNEFDVVEFQHAISYITDRFGEVYLSEDITNKYKILQTCMTPIIYLTEHLEFEGLMHHFLGLVASAKFSVDNENSEEQLDLYLREVTTIIEEKAREEDIFDQVMDRLQAAEVRDEDIQIEDVLDDLINTKEVGTIIEETLSDSSFEDVVVSFTPKYWDNVGIWYVSPQLLDLLNNEVKTNSPGPYEALIYLLSEKYSFSRIKVDLIADRLEFAEVIEDLVTNGIIIRKTNRYQSTYKHAFPELPALRDRIDYDMVTETFNELIINGFQLKSQLILRKLIAIYKWLQIPYLSAITEAYFINPSDNFSDYIISHVKDLYTNKCKKFPWLIKSPKVERYMQIISVENLASPNAKENEPANWTSSPDANMKNSINIKKVKVHLSNLPKPAITKPTKKVSLNYLDRGKGNEQKEEQ